ncbi:MAG: vitamin-B12 independent methionine synthase, partial [Chloroflexota bacterium]
MDLGVVDPRTATIKSVEFVAKRVRTLLKYRRPEQIFLNPECGFGTFANHPVNTSEIAVHKRKVIRHAADALKLEVVVG